jgi:hypothetical protein
MFGDRAQRPALAPRPALPRVGILSRKHSVVADVPFLMIGHPVTASPTKKPSSFDSLTTVTSAYAASAGNMTNPTPIEDPRSALSGK